MKNILLIHCYVQNRFNQIIAMSFDLINKTDLISFTKEQINYMVGK